MSSFNAGLEMTMPFLDQLQKQYDADVKTGGAESARAKFDDNKNKLVAQLQGQMAGPATPLYNPQVLKALPSMTPDTLPALISGSKYTQTQVQNRLRDAQATRQVAEAQALAGGKDWKEFVDAEGGAYRSSALLGKTQKLDRESGEWQDYAPGVPANARPKGAKGAGPAAEGTVPPLTDEENAQLAEFARVYGRSIPAPQFGTGAAATNARTAFYRNLISDMGARGETPTAAALQAAVARASQESLKRITTLDTVLRSEEGEALKLLEQVQEELTKLGGVASPYLRGKWNLVETQVLGDPKFVRLNTLMSTFVDTLGRLSSNATGAAGTPVAYLNFAKQFANKDFNLEQMKEFKPTFEDFVKARRAGVDSALKNLTEKMAPPARKEDTKVPPATQAERDKGAAETIRAEYDKAVATSKDPKATPDARKRALADARSTRAELKKMGVDVPEPGEMTTTDTNMQQQVTKAFGKYEPDTYEYRVSPDGKVQRRKR